MNKSESKYFNTALLMDQALIELLEKKELSYISVKEICEKAGVNRSTFYLHYETIGDLLEETTEYIHNQFLASFDQKPEQFVSQIKDAPLSELILVGEVYLRPYLKFVYENRSVFKAALNNPAAIEAEKQYSEIKKYIFKPIMDRFKIPKDVQNYWMAYYFSGIWAIIWEWINRDCKEPVEQIESIIKNCVQPDNILRNKRVGE